MKYARYLLKGAFGLIAGLLLIALVGMIVPQPLFSSDIADTGIGLRRILVLSNPIHTDIALPIDDATLAMFAFLEESGMPVRNANARWLVFGWGGRTFYTETPTWADLKPWPVFKGLTIDASVVHADIAGDIVLPTDHVMAFDVGEDGYGKLLGYIRGSFVETGAGIEPIPGMSYNGNDRFFEAHGRFNALVGCNTWTARGLREAGLRTGWWNALPVSLTTSLSLFN